MPGWRSRRSPISPAEAASSSGINAEVVVGCESLQPTLDFFVDELGFELEKISPADGPTIAVVAGHGLRLRLEAGIAASRYPAGRLRLTCDADTAASLGGPSFEAPNGTTIEVVVDNLDPIVPPVDAKLEVSAFASASFGPGRASMGYRDLLPRRQGGRYIASHIQVKVGGPIPDYVHYHRIRFQMIFCRRGWVRVVYEDQGPPFVLQQGDCVLQPPGIRHRVLESSHGLEVVEIGCPAVHDTMTDPALDLPNAGSDPERLFGGQRFTRHVAAAADWIEGDRPGLRHRDLGIEAATEGLAKVLVVAVDGSSQPASLKAPLDSEFYFVFITSGSAVLDDGQTEQPLATDDSAALPPGEPIRITALSEDFEALEVTVPAAPVS